MINLKELRRRIIGEPNDYGVLGPTWLCPREALKLIDALEAAQKDAARLMFACQFDGFTTVEKDRYDYACDCMAEAGRDEPNEEDELNGMRRLIDAAMLAELPKPPAV